MVGFVSIAVAVAVAIYAYNSYNDRCRYNQLRFHLVA